MQAPLSQPPPLQQPLQQQVPPQPPSQPGQQQPMQGPPPPPLGPGSAAPPQAGPPQLPPQMFTTAAQLLDLTDKKLTAVLRDGRKLTGILRSWDQFANLVLQSTVERIFVPPGSPIDAAAQQQLAQAHVNAATAVVNNRTVTTVGYYTDIPRGLFIVRGENVLLLGEIDLDREVDEEEKAQREQQQQQQQQGDGDGDGADAKAKAKASPFPSDSPPPKGYVAVDEKTIKALVKQKKQADRVAETGKKKRLEALGFELESFGEVLLS